MSIYCISFFVKAVLSYKCMDAMHHGLLNKMRDDETICTHRENECRKWNKPSLSMHCAFCRRVSGWDQHILALFEEIEGRYRANETTIARESWKPHPSEAQNPRLMQWNSKVFASSCCLTMLFNLYPLWFLSNWSNIDPKCRKSSLCARCAFRQLIIRTTCCQLTYFTLFKPLNW